MAIIRRNERTQAPVRSEWDPLRLMQDVLRWDPLRNFDPFRQMQPLGVDERAFMPHFEVKETKDGYVFKADLPGVKESDLDISISGNLLAISGKREAEERDEGETWYAYERAYGTFTRSFTLPESADSEHVKA